MSCCGTKREQLKFENKPRVNPVIKDTPTPERSATLFEYIGHRSMKIRATSSGRTYYFRYYGFQIQVAFEDKFALMAESDLRPVKQD